MQKWHQLPGSKSGKASADSEGAENKGQTGAVNFPFLLQLFEHRGKSLEKTVTGRTIFHIC